MIQILTEALQLNTSLMSLDLSSNRLNINTLQPIMELMKTNDTITQLSLANNCLTAGVSIITSMLLNNTHLTSLDLMSCEITDSDALKLSNALMHSNHLKTLNLSHNKIRADGFQAIAALIGHNTILETLELGYISLCIEIILIVVKIF